MHSLYFRQVSPAETVEALCVVVVVTSLLWQFMTITSAIIILYYANW